MRDAATNTGNAAAPLVCVGVITRGRPKLLELLLQSLAVMDRAGLRCCFAIVENNDELTVGALVAAFQSRTPDCDVIVENEPRLGIASARNHVLDIALRTGADALAFIDDDETAGPDWLHHLWAEMSRRSLDMAGGPVRLHPVPEGASVNQRLVWNGLQAISRRDEQESARAHQNGGDARLPLATNNWLASVQFLQTHQLRFDETLGFAGGEDTALYRKAVAAGARTGWAPNAVVHEWMPPERLSFAYQYARNRDRAMSAFHGKYPKRSASTALRAVASSVAKLAGALVYAARSLIDSGASLVAAVQAVGFAAGRVKAAFGARSQHYRG
ncbi:glycosyltransferase [Mesorhizobium sp. NBSH29]|uniref:glycosyltransferase family 2 protein n=1 Tax=Mesorhizobium sp. NBSH29 TaxID=2654249 RepID=UPI0018964C0A|nr:glycosyltransferase [Mesorhizobium sp. NBSH29]QPC87045.1 glycosyltransferase [Mesorhizobium sp. NBSH29]